MADENNIEETPEETPEAVEETVAEDAAVEEPVVAEAPAAEEPVAEEAPAAEEETVSNQVAEVEEPVVEESSNLVADVAAEEPVAAGPAPQSQPKKKRKRLPRSERPKKGRRVYTPATERKSIVRLPKPEHERGRRQERRGVVVSSAMDKTIVVKVDMIKSHPKYKKVVRRSVKFHAHDEQNSANVGDVVRIVETRPLSKTKNWRLAEIVEVAK